MNKGKLCGSKFIFFSLCVVNAIPLFGPRASEAPRGGWESEGTVWGLCWIDLSEGVGEKWEFHSKMSVYWVHNLLYLSFT
jgi:hypothetical protein